MRAYLQFLELKRRTRPSEEDCMMPMMISNPLSSHAREIHRLNSIRIVFHHIPQSLRPLFQNHPWEQLITAALHRQALFHNVPQTSSVPTQHLLRQEVELKLFVHVAIQMNHSVSTYNKMQTVVIVKVEMPTLPPRAPLHLLTGPKILEATVS